MDKECGNDRVTPRHDLILWTVLGAELQLARRGDSN